MQNTSPGRSGVATSSRIPAPPAAAGDSARQQPAGSVTAGLDQDARASPSRIPHISTAATSSISQALQPTSARQRAAADGEHKPAATQPARPQQQPMPERSPPRLPRVAKQPPPPPPQQQQQQQQQPDQHLQPWLTHRQRQPHPHRQDQRLVHQPLPQQRASHSKLPVQHGRTYPAAHALSGYDASKRLHEFLVTQQQRREQLWLIKYGRLLGAPAPASLAQPCADPKSLYRHPVPGQLQNSSGHNYCSSRPVKLPQLPASSQQRLPAASHTQLAAATTSAAAAAAPAAARWRPDAATVATAVAAAAAQYSSSWAGTADPNTAAAALPEQRQEQASQVAQLSAPSLDALHTSQLGSGLDAPPAPAAAAAPAPAPAASQGKPCRDLAAELQVARAIRAREDAIDKLAACCSKMGAAQAGGGVLLATEPLFRLFFRLVASYRSRTLEVVEAHAAWQRRLGGGVSAGLLLQQQRRPYLSHLGERLAFLDAAGWVSGRLLRCSAVQDPLLSELTPDGVPIEDVTSFDMRRGLVNFSAEALRVRMARTVLAAAGAPLPPHMAGSLAAALQQQQHLQEQQQMMDAVLQQEAFHDVHHQQQQQSLPQERQAQMAAAAAAALNILLHRPPAAAEVAEVAEAAAAAVDGVAERLAERAGEHRPAAESEPHQCNCGATAAPATNSSSGDSSSSSSSSEPADEAPAAGASELQESAHHSQGQEAGEAAAAAAVTASWTNDDDDSIIDAMLADLVMSLPAAAPSLLPHQISNRQQSRASSCSCQDAAAIDVVLAELLASLDSDPAAAAAAQCIDEVLGQLLVDMELATMIVDC